MGVFGTSSNLLPRPWCHDFFKKHLHDKSRFTAIFIRATYHNWWLLSREICDMVESKWRRRSNESWRIVQISMTHFRTWFCNRSRPKVIQTTQKRLNTINTFVCVYPPELTWSSVQPERLKYAVANPSRPWVCLGRPPTCYHDHDVMISFSKPPRIHLCIKTRPRSGHLSCLSNFRWNLPLKGAWRYRNW